jgi:septum formation protein
VGKRQKIRLILASRSPRRKELLEKAGYEIEVVLPLGDETPPQGETDPHRIATALAMRKARSVYLQRSDGLILGADTVTVLAGEIIGKPWDDEDARKMLRKLAGTRHVVITAVCLIEAGTGAAVCASEETGVEMKEMTDAEIEQYVSSGESMGASGAYKIQETGDQFVENLEGSFSNVVGLPLELVEELLKRIKS